jgi:carbonic anhydrase
MLRRRELILRAIPASAVAACAALWSRPLSAQTKLSPDEALKTLMTGNERYAANKLTSTTQDLRSLRSRTAIKQEPFACVLACADSRVPVELLFDQTIGQIFTTRVAGNLADPDVVASIEYAVAELGVKVVLVLGHSGCGAVHAAMKGESVPGQISVLYQGLHAAIAKAGSDEHKAVELNAAIQADQLRSSTVIHEAVHSKTLRVESGVYDLTSGIVRLNSSSI